ncbi:MAG: hypothetical protein KGJ55_09860 [Gammaproteobacteria bacterium]|nr:hypothetical protein [Gammaproteobacteria bacterium]
MSPLQWALLILAVAAVIAVYWFSRRDRRAMQEPGEDSDAEPLLPPKEQQLDIFGRGFDEYGVGKPRRVAPSFGPLTPASDDAAPTGDAPPAAGRKAPMIDARTTQVAGPVDPQPELAEPESESESVAAAELPQPRPGVEQKIISLLIAERNGRAIAGLRLHRVLQAQGLQYGDKQIYHRPQQDGRPVFSVASLVKPGYLDPAAAADFSTPGLALFLMLPGPLPARQALNEMLATARALAAALDGQVYDDKRQPLTEAGTRALQTEVEAWARRQPLADR